MSILLGNLTTKQIQTKLDIQLSDNDLELLDSMRQDSASSIKPNEWHGFDIPFNIVCGSMETAQKVYDILKKYGDKMKGQLQISVEDSK